MSVAAEERLKELQVLREDCQKQLHSLVTGMPYDPVTSNGNQSTTASLSEEKRKNCRPGNPASPKRLKMANFAAVHQEEGSDAVEFAEEASGDETEDDSEPESDGVSEFAVQALVYPLFETDELETEDTLKTKIIKIDETIGLHRSSVQDAFNEMRELTDQRSTLEKQRALIQKEKNAFCSLQRSQVLSSLPMCIVRCANSWPLVFAWSASGRL